MKAKKTINKNRYIIPTAIVGAVMFVVNVVCCIMGDMITKYTVGNITNASAQKQVEVFDDGMNLAREIESEGIVLVKNEELLPLDKLSKVNVFGWSSVDWVTNGSGSGQVTGECEDLYDALDKANIKYNRNLKNMYSKYMKEREYFSKGALNTYAKDFCKLYEPSIEDKRYYTSDLLTEAESFSDTALVVIGRVGGESNDAPKAQYKYQPGQDEVVVDNTRTYLDFSTEEEALLEYVGEQYENVIVLINSTNAMTLGAIETIPGIDACLVVGCTGMYGTDAIVDVLKGAVSPSGRLADTYAYSLSTAAAYANAGFEGLGKYTNGSGLYPYDGKTVNGNVGDGSLYEFLAFTDYSEGVYVGYRWYETADAEGYWDDKGGYEKIVQYPFGFGLSYSQFDWEVLSVTPETCLERATEIEVKVKVTNIGEMPAKDVVQLYYTPPYGENGSKIEKSAVNLGDFQKTKLLSKNESEIVTLHLTAEDMASYDAYDDNNNGHIGYELEKGNYILSLRKDSHTEVASYEITLKEDVEYDKASNIFTGDEAVDGYGIDNKANVKYMTRANFTDTFPQKAKDREISSSIAKHNLYTQEEAEAFIKADDEAITTGKDNGLIVFENGTVNELGLALGRDFNHQQWETLLDQLTINEMTSLVLHNGYGASAALPSIGKPRNYESDGPNQIGSFNLPKYGTGFPNATTLAQTFSKDLAYDFGYQLGREADILGYNGWYGPGCNIHRTALGGRNYEYYSEDPILSGIFTAQSGNGALATGTYMYLKHFIVYDQESYRDGVYVWLTEQTLREIYARPFELAVKSGGCTGLMTAYNRLGAVWSGGSYGLITSLLREEWGFQGAILTDYSDHHEYMCFDQVIRAGGDIWMDGVMNNGRFAFETQSNTFKQQLRRASKNLIYIWLNAYSRAEDAGFTKSLLMVEKMPWWGVTLIAVDVLYIVGFGIWGCRFFLRKNSKVKR